MMLRSKMILSQGGWLILLLLLTLGNAADPPDPPMGIERIARFTPLGYGSKTFAKKNEGGCVQVDLGKSVKIDIIKLFPYTNVYAIDSPNFPVRFKIEAAADPQFKTPTLIVDYTAADVPMPNDVVGSYPAKGASGRYVRLTVTKTRARKFQISKLEVWSGGKDVAEGCPAADSDKGDLGKTPLTLACKGINRIILTTWSLADSARCWTASQSRMVAARTVAE